MLSLRSSGLRIHFLSAVLACLATMNARADALGDACNEVYRKIGNFPGGLYRKTNETFEYEGRLYKGCVVTVVGDSTTFPGNTPLTHAPYPFPDSPAATAGWRADREADGPDGTAYRLSRGNVFCQITGWWDGGDDADPAYVPSPLFVITAKCARK